MDESRPHSAAFIIRLWTETDPRQGVPVSWKGSIENVEEAGRIYFTKFEDLVLYLGDQLTNMGV